MQKFSPETAQVTARYSLSDKTEINVFPWSQRFLILYQIETGRSRSLTWLYWKRRERSRDSRSIIWINNEKYLTQDATISRLAYSPQKSELLALSLDFEAAPSHSPDLWALRHANWTAGGYLIIVYYLNLLLYAKQHQHVKFSLQTVTDVVVITVSTKPSENSQVNYIPSIML